MRLGFFLGALGAGLSSPMVAGAQTQLEAGGLAPPSSQPEPAPAAPAPTEEELRQAEREDSGRGLEFFWLNGEVGFEVLGLQTLKANQLVDAQVVETTQNGLVYGGGIGLRLVFVTVGARFRYGAFPDWSLWTLGAEVGLRIPLGSIEPYFTVGGGYASVGGLDAGPLVTDGSVSVAGWNLRGSGGLDIYLSNAFSIGANLSGDVLFLSRSGLSDVTAGGPAAVYAADGSSVGAGFTATGVVGLHF